MDLLAILSVLPLGAMIRSDFRERRIHIAWLGLFAVAQAVYGYYRLGLAAVVANMAGNALFLAILYLFLWFYVCCIRRHELKSFGNAIGAGDLLFLPALCPLLGLRQFVVFLTVSFALTLAGYAAYKKLSGRAATIPLVGTVGICFAVYLITDVLA